MAHGSPTDVVAKWTRNTKAGVPSYVAGVNGVTQPPGAAAARQKAVYIEMVNAKADKWAANTAKVSLQDWQTAAAVTGSQRISSGVDKAQNKMTTAFTSLLPFIDAAVARLNSTNPRGDLNANIARATAMMQAMSTYKRP